MAEFLTDYGLFLAKTVTLVIALLAAAGGIVALSFRAREKTKGELEITSLNAKLEAMASILKGAIFSKEERKEDVKARKAAKKEKKRQVKLGPEEHRKRLFVLSFHGDIRATEVTELRESITAVLGVATPRDEVVVRLESPGGLVHTYGLAASQLVRIRERNIPLTVVVDKVAASGGYLMACVADRVLAAPFAVLGSIGVLAQLPNFHRLLKKHDIDFEQVMAGEYKRTLTVFGQNTDKAREKFQQELEDTHLLFKDFVKEYRPRVDIERLATGEHWYGSRALQLKLVDELRTSDDYLLEQSQGADLYEVNYHMKKPLGERLSSLVEETAHRVLGGRIVGPL